MKKHLAECIGTATLAILGCGTAMLVGCDAAAGSGYLLTALAFGLTPVAVHILGIGLTGTSVNPARSFGPALAALFNGNSEPLAALWVFIAGPLLGAALAAGVYKALEAK